MEREGWGVGAVRDWEGWMLAVGAMMQVILRTAGTVWRGAASRFKLSSLFPTFLTPALSSFSRPRIQCSFLDLLILIPDLFCKISRKLCSLPCVYGLLLKPMLCCTFPTFVTTKQGDLRGKSQRPPSQTWERYECPLWQLISRARFVTWTVEQKIIIITFLKSGFTGRLQARTVVGKHK